VTYIPAIKQRLSHLILGQKGGQNRIQIIELLKERPYNLNQLAEILDLNYRTIKHHVEVLLKNELVNTSRTGSYGEVYFLTPEMEGNMEIFEDVVKKFTTSKKLTDFTSSPRFFKNVMEQTNDAVMIVNKEEQVHFWNKSAEKLYGHKKEDILSNTLKIFPDSRTQKSMIKKVEKGKKVVGFETKVKQKSGKLIDANVTIDAIKDEDGKTIGFSILSRDITERKRAEEKLRDSEAELSAILSNAPIPMFLVDHERRVQKVNSATIEFAGRPAKEMIGLRGGEALKCLYSLDDPKGCGFGPNCEGCQVRRTVVDTLETGKSHRQVKATLPFDRGEKQEEMVLLVSTALLDNSKDKKVLVCVEDYTRCSRAEKALQEYENK